MKLDFSALVQPTAKAWGQVGTTGTPASTRVCASPLAKCGAGTTGDKPAAVALVADLVVAAPAACPPVSPACPQVTDAGKLNGGGVSPASPLVPVETAQGAAAGKATHARINTCADCLHLLRRGICGEPEAAGLISAGRGFGIVWADPEHATDCAAFSPTRRTDAGRPYRLTPAEGDAAHAQAWDDAVIALYQARLGRLQRRGFCEPDAEDLAERLHLRDVHANHRALCLECLHLTGTTATGWRCGNQTAAQVAHELPRDLVTLFQRCAGFTETRSGVTP